MRPAFAIWITGLPASGKSTLAAEVVRALASRGVEAAVLESDALRRVLTPRPVYSDEERDTFYGAMAWIGALLVRHGVPVVFDATANLREHRARARKAIARFVEVHVDTPLAVCEARDPKGIYEAARRGAATSVPGVQAPYEAPERPDLVVHGGRESPEAAARRVVTLLQARGYLPVSPA